MLNCGVSWPSHRYRMVPKTLWPVETLPDLSFRTNMASNLAISRCVWDTSISSIASKTQLSGVQSHQTLQKGQGAHIEDFVQGADTFMAGVAYPRPDRDHGTSLATCMADHWISHSPVDVF